MSNTRKTNPDLTALLSAARLPERTVDLCLRGDLQAEWEALQQDLENARRSAGESLAAGVDGAEIEEQIRELEATMAAAVLTARLRAVSRGTFQAMALAHPPRPDNQRDQLYGFNIETFNADLIRLCWAEPALDDEQWAQLMAVLTPGQYRLLADTCEVLNHSPVDLPFSSSGSPRAPVSDAS